MIRCRPTLLDRLTDPLDGAAGEPGLGTSPLKDRLARDLEQLLNTRCAPLREARGFVQAGRSVLTFGLPDLASLSLASDADRTRICSEIRTAIARHEPRLTGVRVELRAQDLGPGSGLGFTIRARLATHPVAQPAEFTAVLRPAVLTYHVTSP
jgi:type VI secretion system protein ImpF